MIDSAAASELEAELDWIKLRKELDDLSQKDKGDLWYKYNWFVPTGLAITTGFLLYGITNMNHPTKWRIGAYGRIVGQFLTATIMTVGFLKYADEKTKKIKSSLNS